MTFLHQTKNTDGIQVRISGDWIMANAAELEAELDGLLESHGAVTFQPDNLGQLDLTGAWLLRRMVDKLNAQGRSARLLGFDSSHFHFLETLPEQSTEALPLLRGYRALLYAIGQHAIHGKEQIRYNLGFFGHVVSSFLRILPRPRHWRVTDIYHHVFNAGLQAIPIVTLIAFLISIVLAYQGAHQLSRFGAKIFTVDLVVITLLREMGALLTAIIVAGRSSSAFAAQIGFMKINQEVDALKTMGFDPYEILVLPRIIALIIALPLLTLLADITGLIGASLLSVYMLDLSLQQFYNRAFETIHLKTFLVGMIKAPFFAFIIGYVGTMRGMKVSGSASSVGLETTNAVVQAIFFVILVDALFSVIFSWLDF